jgi:indole-3-glycerol phosphate synthase
MIENRFFIAEVKTESPWGWKSERSWDELLELAVKHGDMVSVHTDPRWGGSLELVERAAYDCWKPVLAKGVHPTDESVQNAFDAGADAVLVVGRVPEYDLSHSRAHVMIEPRNVGEFAALPPGTPAVWNARDLYTGKPKDETFVEVRSAWAGWLAQASYIRTPQDVCKGADGFIVGTYLPEFCACL